MQVLLHVGLPLLVNLAWALVVLVGLPRAFGVPLAVLVAGIPDFGTVLVVSGATALAWSVLRTVLAWAVLRSPRPPAAARTLVPTYRVLRPSYSDSWSVGYSFFSFTRASAVVKRHSIVALAVLRRSTQAAVS